MTNFKEIIEKYRNHVKRKAFVSEYLKNKFCAQIEELTVEFDKIVTTELRSGRREPMNCQHFYVEINDQLREMELKLRGHASTLFVFVPLECRLWSLGNHGTARSDLISKALTQIQDARVYGSRVAMEFHELDAVEKPPQKYIGHILPQINEIGKTGILLASEVCLMFI